ncbi:hypothetical protein ABZX62_04945 [Streptomyces flavidovirens]|uniref:Secreted protein n=1 Tax=Streptomyces flavidovirens TaxID=67298 RepID=A0ABW6RFQ0_9ACTN
MNGTRARASFRRSNSAALLIATTVAAGLLTSTGSAQAAPGGDPTDVYSPAGYSAYLQEQTAAAPEAKEVLDGFKALSAGDKKKFLEYLQDPEVLKAAVDEAEGTVELAEGQTVAREEVKINEDVSLVSELTERKAPLAAASGWDRTATYNHITKVMGVKVTKMSVWVRYHAKRGAATKVYNSGSAKQNFNPGVVLSAENARPWVASGKAHAETVWEGNLTALGGFMQVDKRQHITAAWDGSWTGTLKNA